MKKYRAIINDVNITQHNTEENSKIHKNTIQNHGWIMNYCSEPDPLETNEWWERVSFVVPNHTQLVLRKFWVLRGEYYIHDMKWKNLICCCRCLQCRCLDETYRYIVWLAHQFNQYSNCSNDGESWRKMKIVSYSNWNKWKTKLFAWGTDLMWFYSVLLFFFSRYSSPVYTHTHIRARRSPLFTHTLILRVWLSPFPSFQISFVDSSSALTQPI